MPSYHVAIELSDKDRKRLKVKTAQRNQSVKDYVTELVVKALDESETKK